MAVYDMPPEPIRWGADLATAFATAQAAWPDITKGRTANVGQYRYTYADLSDILEAVRPVLATNGLFITQNVVSRANAVDVWTTLGHKTGQSIDFGPMSFPAGNTPQTAGSAVTYARRYALLAALGLATEDDDGQAAAQAPKPKAAPKSAPAGDALNPPDPKPGNTPAMKRMMAPMNEAGLSEPAVSKAFASEVVGRTIESRNDLTPAELIAVSDALVARIAGAA